MEGRRQQDPMHGDNTAGNGLGERRIPARIGEVERVNAKEKRWFPGEGTTAPCTTTYTHTDATTVSGEPTRPTAVGEVGITTVVASGTMIIIVQVTEYEATSSPPTLALATVTSTSADGSLATATIGQSDISYLGSQADLSPISSNIMISLPNATPTPISTTIDPLNRASSSTRSSVRTATVGAGNDLDRIGGLSTGGIIGVAVGGTLGALLLAAVATAIIWGRRRNGAQRGVMDMMAPNNRLEPLADDSY